MNSIQRIKQDIESAFPGLSTDLSVPINREKGSWWLDLRIMRLSHQMKDYYLVVEWRPLEGFGLSSIDEDSCFGQGPDEVYTDYDQAYTRITELLKNRSNTIPPIVPGPLTEKRTSPSVRASGKQPGKRSSVA